MSESQSNSRPSEEELRREIVRLQGELAAANYSISRLYRFLYRIGLEVDLGSVRIGAREIASEIFTGRDFIYPVDGVSRADWEVGIERFAKRFSKGFTYNLIDDDSA